MTTPLRWGVGLRWATGLLGAFAVTWGLGRFAVDSILVRDRDVALDTVSLRPGDRIRWRSEGYGDTLVGPHGLPGWTPRDAGRRVLLWGDSQVEGLCLPDNQKLHRQIIDLIGDELDCDVLPLAKSGTDARDWQAAIPPAKRLWSPEAHVWVITELSDLKAILEPVPNPTAYRWNEPSPGFVRVAKRIGADAFFAGAKRLLLDPETGGLRRLDFRLGPPSDDPQANTPSDDSQANTRSGGGSYPLDTPQMSYEQSIAAVTRRLVELRRQTDAYWLVVFVPHGPTIDRGFASVYYDDYLLEDYVHEITALNDKGLVAIDMRDDFLSLWENERRLPRGFHNGLPGAGHLNADGNRLIAAKIAEALRNRFGDER
jgi:hypothetical protein